MTVGMLVDILSTYPRDSQVTIWTTCTARGVDAANALINGQTPKLKLYPSLDDVVGVIRTGTNTKHPELQTDGCLRLILHNRDQEESAKEAAVAKSKSKVRRG